MKHSFAFGGISRFFATVGAAIGSAVLVAALAPATHAAELVRVEGAWVRGTVEGQTGSGAYMRLTSSEDAVLTGASCPDADAVEIHEMKLVKDMMTMRKIDRLALPAHQTVGLDHDYHVMLIGLHKQLRAGGTLPLSLQVQDAKGRTHRISVNAPIRPLTSSKDGANDSTKPGETHG